MQWVKSLAWNNSTLDVIEKPQPWSLDSQELRRLAPSMWFGWWRQQMAPTINSFPALEVCFASLDVIEKPQPWSLDSQELRRLAPSMWFDWWRQRMAPTINSFPALEVCFAFDQKRRAREWLFHRDGGRGSSNVRICTLKSKAFNVKERIGVVQEKNRIQFN